MDLLVDFAVGMLSRASGLRSEEIVSVGLGEESVGNVK